jgi:hypothetical protein
MNKLPIINTLNTFLKKTILSDGKKLKFNLLVFYFESLYVNEQPIVEEKQTHVDKSPLNQVNKVQPTIVA